MVNKIFALMYLNNSLVDSFHIHSNLEMTLLHRFRSLQKSCIRNHKEMKSEEEAPLEPFKTSLCPDHYFFLTALDQQHELLSA